MTGPCEPGPLAVEPPRHAALIRIDDFLYRVRIWTEEEWAALPPEARPAGASPISDHGWQVTEPVELALARTPGELLVNTWLPYPYKTWPPYASRLNVGHLLC
jgi:hypothetical protein